MEKVTTTKIDDWSETQFGLAPNVQEYISYYAAIPQSLVAGVTKATAVFCKQENCLRLDYGSGNHSLL